MSRIRLRIPGQLEEIIHDCLRKDPTARPEGVSELAERLGKIHLPEAWTKERAEDRWNTCFPKRAWMASCSYLCDN